MPTTFPGAVDAFPRPSSTTNTYDSGFELDVVIDNLSDALEAVEAEALPALVSLTRSTNQAIATGALTEILWDTEVSDAQGLHSTVTNTGRVTVPTGMGGAYLAVAVLGYVNGVSSSTRTSLIQKNGSTTLVDIGVAYVSGTETIVTAVWVGRLAAADYINAHAYQGTGSSQDVLSTRSSFTVTRLGA